MIGPPGRPQIVDSRHIEDAIRIAGQASDGQTRPQIRQRLVEELKVRGLILAPPAVDSFVDEIVMLSGGLAGRAQHEARRMGQLGQAAVFGVQLLRAARQHRPLPRMESSGMRSVRLDPRHMREPVDLDPDAQAVLDIDTHNPIYVWFDLAGPGNHDDAGTAARPAGGTDAPVLVFLGDYRVAKLGAAASQLYCPVVQQAREAGVILVGPAMRERADDGLWRLYIPWPRTDSSGLAGDL